MECRWRTMIDLRVCMSDITSLPTVDRLAVDDYYMTNLMSDTGMNYETE